MKKLFFLTSILLFVSCSTSISTKLASTNYQKLSDENQIIMLEKTDVLPDKSVFIGDVKIGDSGFTTDCGYNQVLSDVTTTARNAGANIVQIVQLKKPSALGSTCYRMKAKMYRNLNTDALAQISDIRKIKNKSRLPEDADYALIHFYRPNAGLGAFLGYKIKDGSDAVVGRLRNGEKFIYKTQKCGMQTFYGVLETKEEVVINIEKGKEYFVRCSINMGVVLGRPEINTIENYIGMNEFKEMK
jgi:hypothetical protein